MKFKFHRTFAVPSAVFLQFAAATNAVAETVSYTMQDSYFPVQLNDGGDFFSNERHRVGNVCEYCQLEQATVAWREFSNGCPVQREHPDDHGGKRHEVKHDDLFPGRAGARRAFPQTRA